MSISSDLKQVAKELSPILAGFKLALIVISYFGIGSVAKWVISYWYPFTRKVWDWIAMTLNFPEFSIAVKDSLTALVFFLPLGITAVYQRLRPPKLDVSMPYRLFAGFLGIAFFYLVTKGVYVEIASGLINS